MRQHGQLEHVQVDEPARHVRLGDILLADDRPGQVLTVAGEGLRPVPARPQPAGIGRVAEDHAHARVDHSVVPRG